MANRIYWPIGLTRDMPGRTSKADLIESSLRDYAASLFDDGTDVQIGWMRRTSGAMYSFYLGAMNDVYLVEDILTAEKAGADAATVGGHWDPALWPAREAATIPIIGPGEAAMMTAMTLGASFAFLTVIEGYVPIIERNIRLYGFEGRAIRRKPVRRFGMTYENLAEALEGRSDAFLVELEKTARQCIDDGADVIVAGGQLFGPVFARHDFWTIPNTGVPVVEVSACALKMAAMQADLRRMTGMRKSQHINAPFRSPDKELLETALETLLVR
jgi:Asp/Glu/hydantoin racemase